MPAADRSGGVLLRAQGTGERDASTPCMTEGGGASGVVEAVEEPGQLTGQMVPRAAARSRVCFERFSDSQGQGPAGHVRGHPCTAPPQPGTPGEGDLGS
ncbi:hypothetical protein NDU88_006451 [Pleurodeles waltl]|uniref:Uncharacterized protein n=1 Tax=Pleurodeles waltl TaxID=8319 RepID=A0AAV7UL33_PLEWA|nr:hypothetical protein NDU88_006451 [Pleurodeles waltl]